MRKHYQTFPLYAEKTKRKPMRMLETADDHSITLQQLFFVLQKLLVQSLLQLKEFYLLRIKTIQVTNPIVLMLILLFFVLYRNHNLLGESANKRNEIWKEEEKTVKTNNGKFGFVAPNSSPIKKNINPYAPVSTKELSDADVKNYVKRFSKVAIDEMYRYGVPASISLAQAIIESRCGNSTLARNNNNHFGVKCFSKKCADGHCTNHNDDHHKDFFRNFDSAWESWRVHSELLTNGKYKKLTDYGTNYKKWATGLASCGYASDKGYSDKLIAVIEKYKLNQFDL